MRVAPRAVLLLVVGSLTAGVQAAEIPAAKIACPTGEPGAVLTCATNRMAAWTLPVAPSAMPWGSITLTPTTLLGYGITDAVGTADSRLTDARAPLAHTQAAATISDSTVAGRAILTAADAPAQRTVMGAAEKYVTAQWFWGDATTAAINTTVTVSWSRATVLTRMVCWVVTAPTGSPLTVDLLEGSPTQTSMYVSGQTPSIAATKTSTLDAGSTPGTLARTALAYLTPVTLKITAVGSGAAGKGLRCLFEGSEP